MKTVHQGIIAPESVPEALFLVPPADIACDPSPWYSFARAAVSSGLNPLAPHLYFDTFLSRDGDTQEGSALMAGYGQWLQHCSRACLCCAEEAVHKETWSLLRRIAFPAEPLHLDGRDYVTFEIQGGLAPLLPQLRRHYVCSPLIGDGRDCTIAANIKLARGYARQVALEGAVPYAPHIYYPTFLDEHDPQMRSFGLARGIEWLRLCHENCVCADESGSKGMASELLLSKELGLPITYRFDHPLVTGQCLGAGNRGF